jgi:hypothetical protein
LLPAIAGVLDGRVCAAIFVDAVLPHPGRSWFETVPGGLRDQLRSLAQDGVLPVWHEWFPAGSVESLLPDSAVRQRFIKDEPRLPVAFFEEPAPNAPEWATVRCAYLRLSEAYDPTADEAERLGWWVRREEADHLAMLTRPDAVAGVIAAAVAAVLGP